MLLGFYNYSVILTYLGLGSAVTGILMAFESSIDIKWSVVCLLISGACDMFDGQVARAMKNRTEQEKNFGIQIDSLCDLVCFGVLPSAIGYSMSTYKALGLVTAILFTLGAVIRLGYFNVMEMERQQTTTEKRKFYTGLPVTTVSMILPCVYVIGRLLKDVIPEGLYPTIFSACMLIISFLFVSHIKVKKAQLVGTIILAVIGALVIAGVIIL